MAVVTGTICLWFGAIVNIPTGWLHCNGLNGTPNLKDRFVPGAGATYDPGDFGGNTSHNHNFTGDGHAHGINPGDGVQDGAGKNELTTTNPAVGTTDHDTHLPPYHALAYIMKA